MYRHQPVTVGPVKHSKHKKLQNSKYFIHIDDQYTQSQIDLDISISADPHRYQTLPSYESSHRPPKQRREKAFLLTNSTQHHQNPEQISKQSSRIRSEYEQRPESILQYMQNQKDYSKPVQNEQISKEQKIFVPRQSVPKKVTKKVEIKVQERQKQEQDVFDVRRNKYLQQYRGRKSSVNRTIRTSRSISLSPQCSRITERLYRGHINKQPCLRLQRQNRFEKRQKMESIMQNYGFLKRYLTDNQIQDILERFEIEGIPEYKWPMHIVSIVHEKVNRFRRY